MNDATTIRPLSGSGTVLGILVLFCLAPAIAQKSVTIPARSSSTLDEATRSIPAGPGAAPVVPLDSPFPGKSGISRVTPPSSGSGRATITAQSTPVPDPAPTGTVAAMARVEAEKPPMDLATIKRLAELRKELRVAESAARARINLPADDLFPRASVTTIDPLAVPALEGVVEYLERTLKKNVTVRSFYIPGEAVAKEEMWSRCLVLIDWLKANSSIDPGKLTAAGPEPLDKAAPKLNALNIGETEFVSRIELHLE